MRTMHNLDRMPDFRNLVIVEADWSGGNGDAYLWDAASCCIDVELLTGQPEPLDQKLQAWCQKLDCQDPCSELFDGDPEVIRAFNEEGEVLARELYNRLNGRITVHFHPWPWNECKTIEIGRGTDDP